MWMGEIGVEINLICGCCPASSYGYGEKQVPSPQLEQRCFCLCSCAGHLQAGSRPCWRLLPSGFLAPGQVVLGGKGRRFWTHTCLFCRAGLERPCWKQMQCIMKSMFLWKRTVSLSCICCSWCFWLEGIVMLVVGGAYMCCCSSIFNMKLEFSSANSLCFAGIWSNTW